MVVFSTDGDQQVIRGDIEGKKFAVFYLKAGVVVAVDAVNCPKEFMAGRQMVDKRVAVDAARLADTSVDLKSLIG